MYTKCLEIAWTYATEFVPLDLACLRNDIQTIRTIEKWPGTDGKSSRLVEYQASICVLPKIDETHVEITYRLSDNAHIPDALWGVSTIVIPQGAYHGEAHWKGDDTQEHDGTAQWRWHDNEGKERKRTSKDVVIRDQERLRGELLSLDKCCAITGESTARALEAAHIIPVKDGGGEFWDNAILLRADLHRLYDDHLFIIGPDGKVGLQGELSDAYIELLKDKALPELTQKRVEAALLKIANT